MHAAMFFISMLSLLRKRMNRFHLEVLRKHASDACQDETSKLTAEIAILPRLFKVASVKF